MRRVHGLKPGEYSVDHGRIVIACPCCNRVATLDWPYRVSEQGTVVPEWRCPCCGWGDTIKLGDFAEETIP